jgi:thioredoxin-like negative regulator of GroEL
MAQENKAQENKAQENKAQGKMVITHLTPADLQALQTQAKRTIIIIKFGATWCNPCKRIAPICEEWLATCPPNILYADIDIDESLDLYMALKNKKMLKGVPTLLAYNTGVARDHWYIPDDSVQGGDVDAVTAFFKRCNSTLLGKV